MNISVRLEGGLGDHLLANRLVHAIKDKYPKSKIYAFSDTEGNPKSIELLKSLYPSIYDEIFVVPNRINKNFKLNTRFGEEEYPAHIENLPKDVVDKMMSYDRFYDLHIDSLKWLNYDFDWLRYFYFFPKPEIDIVNNNTNQPYVLAHLYSRPNSPYNLEHWYVINLIKKISEFTKVIIITSNEHISYYEDLILDKNITFETTQNTLDIFSIASNCSAFIGIDSGIRYIPYHFSKPSFVFSKYCKNYGNVAYSHLLRWLLFKNHVIPMHFDVNTVVQMIKNCSQSAANQLYPEILSDIDLYTVDRKL
jgi:ADP-heptose:LPS heptosyltransferase